MDSNEFECYDTALNKVRKIKVGDKMAGRHGNRGFVSIVVPDEDMLEFEDTKMDLIFDTKNSEMFSIRYIKKAIFIGHDIEGLTTDKEYYIYGEKNNQYFVRIDEENEILVAKEHFVDVE